MANFIVGFNNWGKSTIIRELFGQKNFSKHITYKLRNTIVQTKFCVQSISNDDIGQNFINEITDRLDKTSKWQPDLFATLCPSMEVNNNYQQILSNPIFNSFDQLNFFLLKYKWEHHAELITQNIISDLNGIANTVFFTIDSDASQPVDLRASQKVEQIREILNSIY